MQPEKQASSKGSTLGLALLFGVIGASLISPAFGFVSGAMLGALLAQVLHLRSRTQSLEQQLQALARSIKSAAAKAPEEQVAPKVSQPPARTEPPVAEVRQADAAPTASRPAPPPPPPRAPAAPIEPSAFDRALEQFMTWLKGGNPLARSGIVILFFGATFLAKYAAENSLFPVELRFIAIAIGAFALLIVGWRLRDTRAVYAQLLQGGGIAGLYLTVFAATRLYELLPVGLAFGLMVVIALAAAILAVGQNSLSLAVIGTAGGFLAPIMVSTGSGNHVALFTYYAVLNLGVFAVAWFRTWRVLNVLGFVFTFSITGLWRARGYESADLFSADAFLILFFLMYVGVSILNCVRQPPSLKGYVSGSLVFGLPVVAFALHASMVSRIEYAMAWSAFGLGVFYLLLGWLLYQTRRETFHLLVEAFAALGVIFGSLAIPLAFDTRTTAAMWAVEGAGLLWLGVRQQRKLARAFGALLQIGAGCGYFLGLQSLHDDPAVLNSAYLGTVMLGVAGVCSGYWLFGNRERQARYEVGAEAVFTLWGVAWWLLGGLREIERFVATGSLSAALAFAAFTVALLAWVSLKREWRLPLLIAAYLPSVVALFALLHAITLGHPFADWAAIGWLLLFVAHFAMVRLGESRQLPGIDGLNAGACWVLTLIAAWEASWKIGERTTGVWSQLPWGVVPALVVAWMGRYELRPRWPLAAHSHVYRTYAVVPLVIAIGLWIVAINLTSTGDSTWLPYLPLLNPLDVSAALCFAAFAMWWSSLDETQRAQLWPFESRALIAVVAALVFLWLNAALIRSLHHNFGAPITWYGMTHSTLVQASLSIFWGVLGFVAMTVAARQGWRYVWMVGVSLMVVVVAKLFFVDLSSVGTIAQITSFLTVGALLVVTGYLAPLPPRKATSDQSPVTSH